MIERALMGALVVCTLATETAAELLSWRGCAMSFIQNVIDLGNLRLDVPPEKLGPNAKLMSEILARNGIAAAGIDIHSAYAHCAEPLAIKGMPVDPGEKRASECAAGSVIRLTVLQRLKKGESLAAIKEGAPEPARAAAEHLHNVASEFSFTKAVWASLESGLYCIDRARQETKSE